MIEISEKNAHLYIPYTPGVYKEDSKHNISTCKYFSKTTGEDGWDQIRYYYSKK